MINKPKAILDTCVLVDILQGRKKDLKKKLSNIDIRKCAITDLTRFELICGAYASEQVKENLQLVNDICSQFQVYPTANGYEHAARQKIRLRKEGNTISDIDLLIGSVCATEGLPLITGNIGHMERIENLQIIPW